ncbi:hypothetical protein FKW77_000056 [Venturia effusa]|uniref:Uncharacterized protein n=1 Tax=Venturia effusa TaxID=50376 RepID=A0A517LJH0_9PEZI|nr:hypothetical protein FKW77_000056 [Venturia effusa]
MAVGITTRAKKQPQEKGSKKLKSVHGPSVLDSSIYVTVLGQQAEFQKTQPQGHTEDKTYEHKTTTKPTIHEEEKQKRNNPKKATQREPKQACHSKSHNFNEGFQQARSAEKGSRLKAGCNHLETS